MPFLMHDTTLLQSFGEGLTLLFHLGIYELTISARNTPIVTTKELSSSLELGCIKHECGPVANIVHLRQHTNITL